MHAVGTRHYEEFLRLSVALALEVSVFPNLSISPPLPFLQGHLCWEALLDLISLAHEDLPCFRISVHYLGLDYELQISLVSSARPLCLWSWHQAPISLCLLLYPAGAGHMAQHHPLYSIPYDQSSDHPERAFKCQLGPATTFTWNLSGTHAFQQIMSKPLAFKAEPPHLWDPTPALPTLSPMPPARRSTQPLQIVQTLSHPWPQAALLPKHPPSSPHFTFHCSSPPLGHNPLERRGLACLVCPCPKSLEQCLAQQ